MHAGRMRDLLPQAHFNREESMVGWSKRDSIRLAAAALAAAPSAVVLSKARIANNKSLSSEAQVDRLIAVHEIQNLMGRYEYFHVAGLDEQIIALFAQKTPGTKLELNRGVYEGIEGVRKFVMATAKGEGDRIGHLHLHALTTPVIEVAADGKTAQGVWVSPGVETGPAPNGEFHADWSWLKYGVDFVKEDGQWKFWHLHMYRVFTVPFNKSWAEMPPPTPRTAPEADRPATFHAGYSPTAAPENVPAPPTPYSTWDDSRAFVK
jgi:hypothetical protein